MKKILDKIRGFTLTEIIVVVAIVGVISSVVIVSVLNVKKHSRDEKRIADIQTLKLAIRLYKDTHGKYPLPGCGAGLAYNPIYPNGATSPHGNNSRNPVLAQWSGPGLVTAGGGLPKMVSCDNYIQGLVPEYLSELPKDPNNENTPGQGFLYMTNFEQTEYKVLINGSVESEHPQSGDAYAPCPKNQSNQCYLQIPARNQRVPADKCFAVPSYAIYSDEMRAGCFGVE